MNQPAVAEILAIGTEILFGQIVDTNSQILGRLFPEYGIHHFHRQVVGDNRERIRAAIALALSRSDMVFTIGGLGPTEDDVTREAIADAFGESLLIDESYAVKLRRMFAQRNLPWVESQISQARHPPCGQLIENPNGTAPAMLCRKDGKVLVALPGPRFEFLPLAEGFVREVLSEFGGDSCLVSHTIRVCGMGESRVEEALRDLFHSANPTLGIYAHPGDVELRLTASAIHAQAAEVLLQPMIQEIAKRLGSNVYSVNGMGLAEAVLARMQERGETLCTAESCTGGMLAEAITAIPGSSEGFIGGAIPYCNEQKSRLLGVKASTLLAHGAVSQEVASEMALGARERFGTDWAIAITGIAGPGGGSPEKPVGLVFLVLAGAEGVQVSRNQFRGTREFIRRRSVAESLTMLWQSMAKLDG